MVGYSEEIPSHGDERGTFAGAHLLPRPEIGNPRQPLPREAHTPRSYRTILVSRGAVPERLQKVFNIEQIHQLPSRRFPWLATDVQEAKPMPSVV